MRDAFALLFFGLALAAACSGKTSSGSRLRMDVAEARQVLHTTRRVAIPLLEHLDRSGLTRRLPDDRRTVIDTR